MKKMIAGLLTLMMVCVLTGGALAWTGVAPLQGEILQVNGDGSFLMETADFGQVLVLMAEDAVLSGVDILQAGQYVFVSYSGAMARSIPPQVTAMEVDCHVIYGTVASLAEDGTTALVDAGVDGQVLARLPEGGAAPMEGDFVAVYTNGIMATSEPPQVNALKLNVYTVNVGVISEIGEGYFLLDDGGQGLRVNVGRESDLPEGLEEGDEVTVYSSGQQSMSLPPQVFGLMVLPADDGE